jgi:hypothetical protein
MPLLVCVAELDTEADPELARKIRSSEHPSLSAG